MAPAPPQRILLYIMLAVLVWGALLALGAYLFGETRQAAKAALILGCVLAFLGVWGALLKYRAGRKL